ncbi:MULTISPECIES: Crp/Fnr family transcriptional regulator [Polaribacter]|uniref:Crp/Fnr family transcriptional regulator n=1 Tax=Polaribacter sejongensis TaxID=985043 RepID=A0AAJ1QUF5_9FLAO|nr:MULTISPECIES: Crp/Fnr family transcriptional regulator [Polaribacter]MDN3618232.1 Crp/Fnr family transcriptional regulator [Polaribacter undariae]UWD30780.1 Crp/Fnr family transcriptional regulator [Polaribacter undariae]
MNGKLILNKAYTNTFATTKMNIELKEISTFFETEYPLNKDGLRKLLSLFKVENIKKGTHILNAGTEEKHLRFLNKGVIREYYATSDKETNINFYTKPQFITDLYSFNADSKTKKQQETLSDTQLLSINKSAFRELLKEYDCGKSFIDLSFQQLLKQKELFEYNRITKTAEELYNELFIYRPNWLDKIPQYHIASYLNITPETLSRIRKRSS